MVRRTGAVLFLLVACKSATLHGETTAHESVTKPALAATAPLEAGERQPWKVAVSEQRWGDAAKLFDALDPHPTEPSLRYVRARMALELGDDEQVIDLLNGLEAALPELADDIRQVRASAMSRVGPFDVAAAYFEGRSDSADRLRAARAWLDAGKPNDALRVLTKARLGFVGTSASKEADWRALHAEVMLRLGNGSAALEDYVWIALHAPTSRHADLAVKHLESSKRLLTKGERYDRLAAFAEAGDLDAALAEANAIRSAPGPIPSTVGVQRHLAWAYYQSRRDYLEASRLFLECARKDSSRAAADLFYSARALSRAHHDVEAIARYQELIRKQPSSKYAVSAKQLIGRLWFARGAWSEAVTAHDAYLLQYGSSKHHRAAIHQAKYERALALLALKDGRALPALEQLERASSSANQKALLLELVGVARSFAGDVAGARRDFETVIAERPLSFGALAAAARLRSLQLPVPPELGEASAEDQAEPPPLEPKLPPRVQLFVELGLDADAEAELAAANGAVFDAYAPRSGEAACLTYGRLSTAKERYRKGQKVIRERAVQRVAAPATQWAWDCLYPRPYSATVARVATETGVESSMVYAVMRQESAFNPTVESPAAAYGLMQIIEPTARQLARDKGVPYVKASLLTPEYNVELGGLYLKKLLQRFDGQLALAAGAYNAGPGAMTRWLETGQDLALDVFVARILYEETRNYVQRVVANWARYRYLEGGVTNIPQLELTLPPHRPLASDDY